MGMRLGLTAVDDETVRAVLADPPLIWKVLAPGDEEMYLRSRNAGGSWLSRLFGKRKVAPVVAATVSAPTREADLDKAWAGIHYLLTGTAWNGIKPLNFLLLGGEAVGSIDVGYGPARAFYSAEVREISNALSEIGESELRKRFNPSEMMKLKVYPEIWNRDVEEDDTIGYCVEYYKELRVFLAAAAKEGSGIIISIT